MATIRRRFDPDEKAALLEEFEQSGLSRREFAELVGLERRLLDKWIQGKRKREAPALVPVRIREPEETREPIELVSPSGWTLRVPARFDEASLRCLLGLLGAC